MCQLIEVDSTFIVYIFIKAKKSVDYRRIPEHGVARRDQVQLNCVALSQLAAASKIFISLFRPIHLN